MSREALTFFPLLRFSSFSAFPACARLCLSRAPHSMFARLLHVLPKKWRRWNLHSSSFCGDEALLRILQIPPSSPFPLLRHCHDELLARIASAMAMVTMANPTSRRLPLLLTPLNNDLRPNPKRSN
jgi:hypothetical protein